ncbi:MAG: DEAD/DEAH box helicase [Hyphomicrobiales bacterium]|nr:DEAD/DEAH box helicase [Hyphomicrobiales bacterium]
MDFLIADTFTDSLARLTGEEQKAAKTSAFDLQLDPANPGLSFHKLDKVKDKNFWSVRVNRDIRIIVHRSAASLLLCYVDHHDRAYAWAERRKLETHPKTGAAQLVEIRETVKEVFVPIYVETEAASATRAVSEQRALFADVPEAQLLEYGVPAEWLKDVKSATEDTLFAVSDHLPAEAAEALLELATGGRPRVPPMPTMAFDHAIAPLAEAFLPNAPIGQPSPFEHPDAQRRFRVIGSAEELQRALDYPWDKWTIFLHPAQRDLVERDYNGPARVSGSAGTGKTIVALHRAVHLARTHRDARILLTTFSETLANALRTQLRRLLANEPSLAERISVHSLNAIGQRLYKSHIGEGKIAPPAMIHELVREAASAVPGHKFRQHFLRTEWEQVVDTWQLESWEAYRDVPRLGRKTRLPEAQRAVLWSIFERVRDGLKSRGLITHAQLCTSLAPAISKAKNPIFDFAVVDEAQDLAQAHLRFLAALGGGRPNALFFAGDLGQRIFQQPFSWKSLGVDVRGRSRTLRVNYRTSHQIRMQADRLLGPEVTDVDGNTEKRRGTISVFNGPAPTVQSFASAKAEIEGVGKWIAELAKTGAAPHEFGIFVRSEAELDRARAAVQKSEMAFKVLDEHVSTESGHVSIGTMHLAKGLEFRAVAVMACDDDVIPSQERIATIGDDADLQEVYDTERHLLYVACTRARDHLLVTGVEPASEFLGDFMEKGVRAAPR